MRWICWASVSLALLALTAPAVGSESNCGWGGTCASCDQGGYMYGAPACAAPFYGWQPGCCEAPPSPCDNAWAGYCQEQARWRAFCHRLGTGGAASCRPTPASCQPTPAALEPPGQAVPTAPVQPAGEPPGPIAPGWPGQPPVPGLPGGPAEAPLAPRPADLEEPVALPPVPEPLPDESARSWYRFWLPAGNARSQSAGWPRLR